VLSKKLEVTQNRREELDMKRLVSFLFVPVLGCTLIFCNQLPRDTTVAVTQLTKEESDALKDIVAKAYKEVLGEDMLAYYETKFYYMPVESDSPHSINMDRKLDPPLKLLAVACSGPVSFVHRNIKLLLKLAAMSKGVRWRENGREHTLSIDEMFVQIDEGGAGGSMYDRNDMVTIIPTRLSVTR
jgi:hypothetical protein